MWSQATFKSICIPLYVTVYMYMYVKYATMPATSQI